MTTIGCPNEMLPQPDQPCTALTVNLADEESVSLANILQGSKWIVKRACTCEETIDLSFNGGVSVVLCERRMPDGTWHTLLDGLRALPGPPAVIVVSKWADEHLWIEVLSLGGYDVLMTPFDRNELFRVLFSAWMSSKPEPQRIPAGFKRPPVVETVADQAFKRRSASGER